MTQKGRKGSAVGGCAEWVCPDDLDVAAPGGHDLDLAAALACEGQQFLDRESIRDPFRQPLGACGLVLEMLDGGHVSSTNPRNGLGIMVRAQN